MMHYQRLFYCEKTGLSGTNHIGPKRFDSACNHFGDDLVLSIVEANLSEVLERIFFGHFAIKHT